LLASAIPSCVVRMIAIEDMLPETGGD
jgi:hypothetical protein